MLRTARPTSLLLILLLAAAAFGQNWPGKISGYKLHDPKLTVTGESGSDAAVRITGAKLADIGLAGTTIELEVEIVSRKAGADVDFVTFRDVRVNGMAVEPKEYRGPFSIKKGEAVKLASPVRVVVPITSHPAAIYAQLRNSTARLKITGTAFVFGRFKRFGIGFKRVAPVKLALDIENPIKLL